METVFQIKVQLSSLMQLRLTNLESKKSGWLTMACMSSLLNISLSF